MDKGQQPATAEKVASDAAKVASDLQATGPGEVVPKQAAPPKAPPAKTEPSKPSAPPQPAAVAKSTLRKNA